MKEFSYSCLETATNGFSLERFVGKGSHGCVYKGILKRGKLVLAVKKPSVGLQFLNDNTKLDNEIDILSSLRSPHIVNLLGVCHDSNPKLLVTEFMSNGSLHDFLHNASNPPSWLRRITMALQIVKAVQALHSAVPPIIHRDIKTTNILLDSHFNAKLADFGLAVRLQVTDHKDGNWSIVSPLLPAGTIGYLDPCYTTPCKLSTKNDVFSMGVVLLELVSGRRAIDVGFDPASIVEWALSSINSDRTIEVYDKRLAVPGNMEGAIRRVLSVAAGCVSSEEKCRPSIREIIEEVRIALETVRYPVWSLLKNRVLRRRYTLFSGRKRTRGRVVRQIIVCENGQKDGEVDASGGKLFVRELLAAGPRDE